MESNIEDVSNMSPNLEWWLGEYARQIDALGTSLIVAKSTKTRSSEAIAPLIKTVWGQREPYNNMCPDGSGNDYYEDGYNPSNRCVTGCEATAMAQVMNYWQWPESSPALEAYTADFEVKALPATTFKWNKMKEDYAQDETGEAADAVAELMRYCGQTDKMNYSTEGSTGIGIPYETMVEIFNYSRSFSELRRDFYCTEEWEDIIIEELSEGRPVLYGGYSTNVGHQFIVDGYDGNGLFHINWGWNGSANNYFVLSVADPGHPGVGGSSANDGYMYFQNAIVRLQPNREGNQEPYAVISSDGKVVTFYYDNQRKVRGGIDIVSDKVGLSPYASVTKAVIDNSFANYNPLSTAYWFYNCDKLEKIVGIDNIKTAWVNKMNSMFSGCSSLSGLDLKGFKTGMVRNMSDMFRGCSSMTSLNISTFDTGNVQDMDAMFRNCSNITSLDLSGFNTEKVSNMSHMFSDCSSLSSLDVSHFNTAKVTSMLGMFSGCSSLKSLDVSQFKTDYVTELGYMFANCAGLTSLDVSSFNTSKVAYMSGMFSGCKSLTSLDLSQFNTANLKDMGLMFENCSSLTTLNLYGIKTDNLTSLNATFSGCSSLTTLDLSSFDTGKVSNMAMTFWGCSNLQTIYVSESKWSTASVTSSNMMFAGCTSLKGGNGTMYDSSITDVLYAHIDMEGYAGYLTAREDSGEPESAKPEPYAVLSEDNTVLTFFYDEKKDSRGGLDVGPFTLFDINKGSGWFSHRATIESVVFDMSFADCNLITSTAYWFYGCSSMTKITDISNLKTDNIFSMSNMFNGCSGLKKLDLSSFRTKEVTDMESMFLFCKSLQTIYVSEENWNVSNVTNSQNMFSGCVSLVGSEGTVFDANHTDGEYARIDKKDAPGYLTAKNSGDTSDDYEPYAAYNDGTLTFYYDDKRNSRIGTTYDLIAAETVPSWNENNENITKAVFDESFASAKPIVTSYWFDGCSSLQSIDGLANLNTSKVTSMNGMFQGCSSLIALDLSHFDTKKVTSMGQMFYGCSSLTALDLSNFDTSNVTYMGFMFNMCSNLSSLNVSSFDTKNVTGMRMMFRSCRNLTSLDVSNFDVQSATDLSEMFAYCEGLTSLDVSGFNTAKAETMGYMFRCCDKLTSLDLSSFSTQSAKDNDHGSWTNYGVDGLLNGCRNLSEVKFGSNFVTDENLSCNEVFAGCNSLVNVAYNGDIPARINPTFFTGVGSESIPATLVVPEEYKANYRAKFNGDKFFGGYFKTINTVAEVNAGADGNTYRVKGVCTGIVNTVYGNWYLKDNTGELYIFGTKDKNGNNGRTYPFEKWGFGVGDILTVEGPKTTYSNTVELVDVSIISIEKGGFRIESVSPSDGILTAEGGDVTVNMSCEQGEVVVEIPQEAQSWLTVSSIEQGTSPVITLHAVVNEQIDRSTTVKIMNSNYDYSQEVVVTQKGLAVVVTAEQFLEAEPSDQLYAVTGVLKTVEGGPENQMGTYGFDISDYTGSVSSIMLWPVNKVEGIGFNAGDIVTLIGTRIKTDNSDYMDVKSTILTQKVTEISIADLLTREDSKDVYYKVTGVVDEIKIVNNLCNLYIADEQGNRLYVYRCSPGYGATSDARSNFAANLPFKVGDQATFIGYKNTYKSTIELDGSIYISHIRKYTLDDVVAIVKLIANGGKNTGYDINGDGVVNVADIIEIVNSMLAGQTTE